MRRYGSDIKRGKLVLGLFALLVVLLSFPLFWLAASDIKSADFFSVPVFWSYGLILTPVALAFVVNYAWRKFDRLNRG